jgi:hypothetical protein
MVDAIGEEDGLALERGIPRLEFVIPGEYGIEVEAGTVSQTNPQLETDTGTFMRYLLRGNTGQK